jgi:diacylglycerol kinase (ATP)
MFRKSIIFLINPNSGHVPYGKIAVQIIKKFPQENWRTEISILKGPEDALALAQKAKKRKVWAVVSVGGDGTLNSIVSGLAGGQTRLGIIPAGTGNGFARALGIPLDYKKACLALKSGKTKKVDLGVVNKKKHFINIFGAGLDAQIALAANQLRWINRFSGFGRYLAAAFKVFLVYRCPTIVIKTPKQEIHGKFLLTAVSNSPLYGFSGTIAPGAKINDGLFNLVLLKPMNLIQAIFNARYFLTGQTMPTANYLKASTVKLKSLEGEKIPVHLDGEPGGFLPAEIKILKKSLKVIVP